MRELIHSLIWISIHDNNNWNAISITKKAISSHLQECGLSEEKIFLIFNLIKYATEVSIISERAPAVICKILGDELYETEAFESLILHLFLAEV